MVMGDLSSYANLYADLAQGAYLGRTEGKSFADPTDMVS